jgi:hypothetical protein
MASTVPPWLGRTLLRLHMGCCLSRSSPHSLVSHTTHLRSVSHGIISSVSHGIIILGGNDGVVSWIIDRFVIMSVVVG